MTKTRRPWHLLLTGLGMMALLGVTPVRADDEHHKHQDHKHQERREHERHDHEWRERQAWCAHHECGYAPGYAYAPPPVAYAPPPPVVYAPPPPPPVVYVPPAVYAPPGLNIVVPIHIK